MRRRKTNDREILRLYKEGKNQKQIAEHFGVSPVAIHKRFKRLIPPETPNFNQLTDKQKKFCLAKAEGKNNIEAAMQSYEVTTRESAKSMAMQLMSKRSIRLSLSELMDVKGIDRNYRLEKLKQHLENPDPVISLKSLDMAFKLSGDEEEAKRKIPEEISFTRVDLSAYRSDQEEEE